MLCIGKCNCLHVAIKKEQVAAVPQSSAILGIEKRRLCIIVEKNLEKVGE